MTTLTNIRGTETTKRTTLFPHLRKSDSPRWAEVFKILFSVVFKREPPPTVTTITHFNTTEIFDLVYIACEKLNFFTVFVRFEFEGIKNYLI